MSMANIVYLAVVATILFSMVFTVCKLTPGH
jgi:hypothetical protein